MTEILEFYNSLNADKSKKCDTCKFSRKVVGSSHHQSCELFNFTEKLQILANKSTTPIIFSINNEDYPMIELNKRAMEKGWCTFPFDFDQIWVYCKLHEEL